MMLRWDIFASGQSNVLSKLLKYQPENQAEWKTIKTALIYINFDLFMNKIKI
jgi:hypothetical protein